MALNRSRRINLTSWLLFAGGLLFYLYYGVFKIYSSLDLHGVDFARGCFAASNYFSGRPIYAMADQFLPYFYLPVVTLVYFPFCTLPIHAAKVLWFLICQVLVAGSFAAAYCYGRRRNSAISAAAAAAVILFCMPVYQIVVGGNINILIFSGLCLIYGLVVFGRDRYVPALIAVFAVIKIYPALLMAAFDGKDFGKMFLRFVGVCSIALAVSIGVFGIPANLEFIGQLRLMDKFVGVFNCMSLTFFIKLFFPAAPNWLTIGATAMLLFTVLYLWREKHRASVLSHSAAAAVPVALFVMTVLMLLAVPSSWIMCSAFYAPAFYFVVFALLEGSCKFRFPAIFVMVLLFVNFWEIICYQFPLSAGHLTIKYIDLHRTDYKLLYPVFSSLYFVVSAVLSGWILLNYDALCGAVARITGAASPGGAVQGRLNDK